MSRMHLIPTQSLQTCLQNIEQSINVKYTGYKFSRHFPVPSRQPQGSITEKCISWSISSDGTNFSANLHRSAKEWKLLHSFRRSATLQTVTVQTPQMPLSLTLSPDLEVLYLKRLRIILIALFFFCHWCLCWGCQQDVSYTHALEDPSCSVSKQYKENQHWQQLDAANCALQTSRKKLCNDLYHRINLWKAKTGKQPMYFFFTPAKSLLEWKSVPAQYCSGVTAASQIHFRSFRDAGKACNGNSRINKVTIYVQLERLASLTCLL